MHAGTRRRLIGANGNAPHCRRRLSQPLSTRVTPCRQSTSSPTPKHTTLIYIFRFLFVPNCLFLLFYRSLFLQMSSATGGGGGGNVLPLFLFPTLPLREEDRLLKHFFEAPSDARTSPRRSSIVCFYSSQSFNRRASSKRDSITSALSLHLKFFIRLLLIILRRGPSRSLSDEAIRRSPTFVGTYDRVDSSDGLFVAPSFPT